MERAQATVAASAVRQARPLAPHRQVREWALEDYAGEGMILGDRTLPGVPEIAIWSTLRCVLVWWCHLHPHGCAESSAVQGRRVFWQHKAAETAERDARAVAQLQATGWRVLIVRTCRLDRETLRTFLHTGNVDAAA